jgi:hypothetical protein
VFEENFFQRDGETLHSGAREGAGLIENGVDIAVGQEGHHPAFLAYLLDSIDPTHRRGRCLEDDLKPLILSLQVVQRACDDCPAIIDDADAIGDLFDLCDLMRRKENSSPLRRDCNQRLG